MKILLKFSALLILTTPITYADGPRNGRWEISARSEIAGLPTTMPAQKISLCIDQSNTESGKPPIIADKSCSFSNYKTSKDKASWDMRCDGQMQMKGSGQIKFNDNEYSGSTEMEMDMGDGESMRMKQIFSAKRLGDC